MKASVRSAAVVVGTAGIAFTVAGVAAFCSIARVTGSEAGPLTTQGVYRITRNPQYVGFVVAATAGAVVSGVVLRLA